MSRPSAATASCSSASHLEVDGERRGVAQSGIGGRLPGELRGGPASALLEGLEQGEALQGVAARLAEGVERGAARGNRLRRLEAARENRPLDAPDGRPVDQPLPLEALQLTRIGHQHRACRRDLGDRLEVDIGRIEEAPVARLVGAAALAVWTETKRAGD